MGKELSKQTRQNWQINAFLFLSAILASLSGVYFLYFPEGFMGGRNPLYNVIILFNRQTWDLVHTWSGVGMIVIATLHTIIHWKWITSMTKKVWNELLAGTSKLSKFGKINVAINFMIGLTGLITAISGIYFLFDTSNSHATQAMFLFNRTTWDLIHTWAGVLMIITFILHFAIHWKWVTKVTRRYFSNEKRVVKPVIFSEQHDLAQSETQI
ncbi:MAG: DUF4405 domain-containing protein [Anaerolineaceae bacterium]|nr:DUF4405 domain-containing protein [Anaerolineaceae bacterium]